MSSFAAGLMLGRGALLDSSWWVARSLREGDGRRWTWLVWTCVALAVLGAGTDLVLSGRSVVAGGSQLVGLGLTAAIAIMDVGFFGVATYRALRSLPARRFLVMGRRAHATGDVDAAAAAFRQAGARLSSGGLRIRELGALAEEGRIRLQAGQSLEAARVFSQLLERARDCGALKMEARAQTWAGDAAAEQAGWQAARADYWAAACAGQEAGDIVLAGRALARLGWLEYLVGDRELARGYFAWSANLEGAGADPRQAASLTLLAACFAMSEGRLEAARTAVEDAIRLSQSADPQVANAARVVLGCVHYMEGWADSGAQFIEKQIEASMTIASRRMVGVLLAGMSLAARRLDRRADASGFAALAARLLAGHPALERLAGYATDPASQPALAGEAAHTERLVRPVPDAIAQPPRGVRAAL